MPSLADRQVTGRGQRRWPISGRRSRPRRSSTWPAGIGERWYVKPGRDLRGDQHGSGSHALWEGHLYASLGVPTVRPAAALAGGPMRPRPPRKARPEASLGPGTGLASGSGALPRSDRGRVRAQEFGTDGWRELPQRGAGAPGPEPRRYRDRPAILAKDGRRTDRATDGSAALLERLPGYAPRPRILSARRVTSRCQAAGDVPDRPTSSTESFDVRWGLIGRARLLRAEALGGAGTPDRRPAASTRRCWGSTMRRTAAWLPTSTRPGSGWHGCGNRVSSRQDAGIYLECTQDTGRVRWSRRVCASAPGEESPSSSG